MDINVDIFFGIFTFIALYYLLMYIWSFKKVELPVADVGSIGYVLLVPALNEERVISQTCTQMERLVARLHVVVIDDGSDDETANIVKNYEGETIHLFQRKHPLARQGKGMALNDAYAWAQTQLKEWFPDLKENQIIIGVTDSDVYMDQKVINEVTSMFQSSADIGAVQAPVSIKGANENLWLLMQDIEFQAFFHFIQKARNWISSVAMGGNGQFTRYSAMKKLGPQPWSRALTEDIDLGMALTGQGQRICFTGKTPVVQHGLTSFTRLIKQRSRWVQGHYQVWRRIKSLWQSNSRLVTKLDSTLYLFMIIIPLILFADYVLGILSMFGLVHAHSNWMGSLQNFGLWVPQAVQLLLAFSIQLIFLPGYSKVSNIKIPWYAGPGLMITFALYTAFIWIIASFMAFYRMARGQWGWIKTEREMVSSADINVSA
ncbi:glycosyltransferase (plasmid) [Alicyclobacillus fastidiosus]|uniref:Glycosyltransferase n=1 Tax=Alicyclobacillus fastidiosus TaxID=392011 RepID=A0ABY6ZPB0_9BACL|nr:glycosyltransferase family 2 protein [Alicyclobacillus fastidiosus]WAH44818.1 glycosyltransferase [Alicyclobacillus fastidiosus]GMA65781.1 N-acetyl-glucosamine transferase [Alicyclobacillus fastidiosus]